MALCIPYFHEPLIRFAVISKSESEYGSRHIDGGDSIIYISKAFMFIGCVILAVMRIMIPMLILVARLRRTDTTMRI